MFGGLHEVVATSFYREDSADFPKPQSMISSSRRTLSPPCRQDVFVSSVVDRCSMTVRRYPLLMATWFVAARFSR
jgi:hypothetical protein